MDSTAHRHAAFQIAVGVDGDVGMVDEVGAEHRGPALVVPPMVRHRLLAGGELRVFFVEPHSVFADRLRGLGGEGISVVGELRDLQVEDVRWGVSGELDARLVEAMRLLATENHATAGPASMNRTSSNVVSGSGATPGLVSGNGATPGLASGTGATLSRGSGNSATPGLASGSGVRTGLMLGRDAAPDLMSGSRAGSGLTSGYRAARRLVSNDGALPGLARESVAMSENVTMSEIAAQVGLSPQRLRALAREQLGMPLARWRIWQRLSRAAEALREGRTPADAAAVAGFADQAHFHRRMREMIGLTPAAVARAVRP
ncbi:hypothetical protein GCM10022248_70210 [Nonomuraea soli]